MIHLIWLSLRPTMSMGGESYQRQTSDSTQSNTTGMTNIVRRRQIGQNCRNPLTRRARRTLHSFYERMFSPSGSPHQVVLNVKASQAAGVVIRMAGLEIGSATVEEMDAKNVWFVAFHDTSRGTSSQKILMGWRAAVCIFEPSLGFVSILTINRSNSWRSRYGLNLGYVLRRQRSQLWSSAPRMQLSWIVRCGHAITVISILKDL